jgi:surface antigen
MLKKSAVTLTAGLLALTFSGGGAFADACSGHDHTGGTVLGAIGGGLIGGFASHGNGLGIVGGAILGGLAGNALSRDMDCDDQPYAAKSYRESFDGPVGRRYRWERGPDHGYIVTTRQYYRGPRQCRDFTQVVYRHGREFDRDGTACRRRGGEWQFQ